MMAGINYNNRIDVLEAKMDGSFETMNARFQEQNKFTNGLYSYITVVLAILGYLIKS